MRRMFSSRSSLLKPRPLERCVRTTSPSSTSTLAPRSRSFNSSWREIVLLPAPLIPVNHNVNPLCISSSCVSGNCARRLTLAVGGEMNSAFLLGVFFPPPAPGAFAFARFDRARARRAPDAGVAARVQRMHRHIVARDVFLHLLGRPVGQRIELDAPFLPFHLRHRRARLRLFAAQSRRPRLQRFQLARQRTHLAHFAAALPPRHARVEEIRPVDRDQPLHFGALREHRFRP